jgi:hypothetical protein
MSITTHLPYFIATVWSRLGDEQWVDLANISPYRRWRFQ